MSTDAEAFRSLVLATSVDVLPLDRRVERRDGYVVIRSPGNPTHYWGNLLVFDGEPAPGDAARWEALFAEEFADQPRSVHRTFAWDRIDGAAGAVQQEFVARGYDLEETICLVADALEPHARENCAVVVQTLDPAEGSDAALWAAVVELQVAGRDEGHAEETYRAFSRSRQNDLRALLRAGRGAWYVAVDPAGGALAGSCGVVVTNGRARFQAVDTALA